MHGPANPKRSIKVSFFWSEKATKATTTEKEKRTWMICNTTTEKFIGTVRKEKKTKHTNHKFTESPFRANGRRILTENCIA
jgi:hypothetical protein